MRKSRLVIVQVFCYRFQCCFFGLCFGRQWIRSWRLLLGRWGGSRFRQCGSIVCGSELAPCVIREGANHTRSQMALLAVWLSNVSPRNGKNVAPFADCTVGNARKFCNSERASRREWSLCSVYDAFACETNRGVRLKLCRCQLNV